MSKWQEYLDKAAAALEAGNNLLADVWLRLAGEYRLGNRIGFDAPESVNA